MTKPEPARYRTTNWKSYNAALRRRGSLLIWLDKEMVWRAPAAKSAERSFVVIAANGSFPLTLSEVIHHQAASLSAPYPNTPIAQRGE